MINEFNTAIKNYKTAWDAFVQERANRQFFASLPPIAIGWKTRNAAEFGQLCQQLHSLSDQLHYGWINDRWLATFHLKNTVLQNNIRVVKIMQRRPGSTDAPGLDNIDFLVASMHPAKDVLQAEPGISWAHEINGLAEWLSVRFASHEAKLRSKTVLDVCAAEMLAVRDKILV